MNCKYSVRKQSAFTLIELLVTVTIITLLCAVLLPSLQAARQTANEVYCKANLAQLAKAWTMYLDAHNGFFYQGVNASIHYGGWVGDADENKIVYRPLNPFLGLPETLKNAAEARVFQCPCDDDAYVGAFAKYGTSYQMNILLADQIQINAVKGKQEPLYKEINRQLPRMNISKAADPARLFLMGDIGWVYRWMPGNFPTNQWHGTLNYYTMAFLDGHVELLKIRKGLFVTPEYRVQPFESLDDLAFSVQVEEP